MKKYFSIFISILFLSSCFAFPMEESVPPPPILHATTATSFKTVEVRRGDVVRFVDITANFVPAQEESLAFDIGEEYISAVYVDLGDTVEAGDIVAELDRTSFQNELEKLEREEAWTRLNLRQLDEKHQIRLLEADASSSLADEANYLDERNTLLAQMESQRIRREYLQFEDERRVLRANLTGTVTTAIAFTEGMQSTANRNLFTIADQSKSVYMVRGPDTVHMEMGKQYDMTINWEPYAGEVIDAQELGISRRANDEETYLVLVGDDPPMVTSRMFASVHVVLAEAKDVLHVPFHAIKKANARVFVYVITDGVRTIRDVEIGLEGNAVIEIISGLAEGEEILQE